MQEGQTLDYLFFGRGVVLGSDADRTLVQFENHGQKLFVTSIMVEKLAAQIARNASDERCDELSSRDRISSSRSVSPIKAKNRAVPERLTTQAARDERGDAPSRRDRISSSTSGSPVKVKNRAVPERLTMQAARDERGVAFSSGDRIRPFKSESPVKVKSRTAPKDFGERVHLLRLSRRLTQHQLAGRIGISRDTLVRIECGRTPRDASLEKISAALDLAPRQLVGPARNIKDLRSHPIVVAFGALWGRFGAKSLRVGVERLDAWVESIPSSPGPLLPRAGEHIRRLRVMRGMTFRELSLRSGVGLTSLEYYERGARRPSIFVLDKLARGLETSLDQFFSRAGSGGELKQFPDVARRLVPFLRGIPRKRWRHFVGLLVSICSREGG
jgi:transcriptional regulator with XRE-family HTH domain